MKNIFLILLLVVTGLTGPLYIHAQSVAINTDSSAADASAILDLKSTTKGLLVPRMTMTQRNVIGKPAVSLLIYQTDNTPGFYYYDGTTWSAVKGAGGGGSDPYWTLGTNSIFASGSFNVGIGTSAPATKLTVQTASGSYGLAHTDGSINLTTYVGGGSNGGWLGTTTNHPLYFFTNNSPPRMAINEKGYVGIGIDKPINKLQVGAFDGSVSTTSDNDLVIANAGGWLAVNQSATLSSIYGTKDIVINSDRNIGLASFTPANKVQIGDMGTVGFTGNHLAIGNGKSATAFNQYDDYFQIASNKDFIFLPQANIPGGGRVGINTTSPKVPLEVAGIVTQRGRQYYFYGFDAEDKIIGNDPASVIAEAAIEASSFVCPSDARIKNVLRISNGAKDLKTLNALRITDYTMKDKAEYGNKQFKKVIAQEVEKVYPQIITRQPGFIPNVYQPADDIEITTTGLRLRFAAEHHLSAGAKKLKAFAEGQSVMEEYTIVSVPSPNEVIISGAPLNAKKVFVYGEEVQDFRKVDYDGLTTLNISATQELSKEVDELKRALKMANENILKLAKLVQKQHAPLAGNRLAVQKTTQQKTMVKKIKRI